MSSYLSGLLTTTTSRYASLRGMISTSETDGDTADDTHLCRVLRNYYTEKGRSFPGWLPPDPKAPQPIQPVYAGQQQVGAGYGGIQQGGGASKLGSLWDSQPQQPAQQQPTSLRQQGRGVPQNTNRAGGAAYRDPYNRSQTQSVEPIQARPLPSQREGSYQTGNPPGSSSSTSSAPGSGSAQDRLKAKLWGSAKAASSLQQGGASPAVQQAAGAFQRTNSYGSNHGSSSGGGGGGGGGGNYEDSFMPGNSSWGGAQKPYMAATSPWQSAPAEQQGGGYGGGAGQRAPVGLPSGPRRGLPGGPRPQR